MMCGIGEDGAVGVSDVVVVVVVVVVLLMVDLLVESRTISASAIIVVGTGRVGLVRPLVGVLMVDGMLMTGGDVIGISEKVCFVLMQNCIVILFSFKNYLRT